MSILLPSRSTILEIARRQSKLFSVSEIEMDEKKLNAAFAWPRLMIKTDPNANIFQVGAALFTGIISEKPLSIGNPHLAFTLLVLILRRNGVSLDISNQDALKMIKAHMMGKLEEEQIVQFITGQSIPQNLLEAG